MQQFNSATAIIQQTMVMLKMQTTTTTINQSTANTKCRVPENLSTQSQRRQKQTNRAKAAATKIQNQNSSYSREQTHHPLPRSINKKLLICPTRQTTRPRQWTFDVHASSSPGQHHQPQPEQISTWKFSRSSLSC